MIEPSFSETQFTVALAASKAFKAQREAEGLHCNLAACGLMVYFCPDYVSALRGGTACLCDKCAKGKR